MPTVGCYLKRNPDETSIYSISAVTDLTSGTGGEISAGGDYRSGERATLTATALDDYRFVKWTEGGALVSDSASYTFTVTRDRTLTAEFESTKTQVLYTVTTSVDPDGGGTASGEGSYEEGTQATVTAVAADGYVFSGWKSGEEIVSTEASYSFAVMGDVTLTAVFAAAKMELVYYGVAENLSYARGNFAATTAGNYALFGGGVGASSYFSDVDAYDNALTRTAATSLSVARSNLAATTVGNYALFGGGFYKISHPASTVNAYDNMLTRTSPKSLSTARYHPAATAIEGYGLFAGGQTATPSHFSTVDAYDTSLTCTMEM